MRRVSAAFLGLLGLVMPAAAFATCGPRPADTCELVNNDRDIFVGRVLGPGKDSLHWSVRVVRSYRGTATGNITVMVWSTDDLAAAADLEIGASYLFYVSKTDPTGKRGRSTPVSCGDWLPLPAVDPEELQFLSRLGSPVADGRVFGSLTHDVTWDHSEPLPAIQVTLRSGGKTYSATTDEQGHFDVRGLPAGRYHLSTTIPSSLLIKTGDDIVLAQHGCAETYLRARPNTIISGRITLPPGVTVEYTRVSALTPAGSVVDSTSADRAGHYTIAGLDPGQYVIGIYAEGMPPSTALPFLPTYAPGTPDLTRATKITITAPATVTGVDIAVGAPAAITTIAFSAALENGAPAADAAVRVSTSGYGERGVGRTNSAGTATLHLVAGVAMYLRASGQAGCMVPIRIGPDAFPAQINATFTADGCREEFNQTQSGRLQSSAGGALTHLPVRVSFPDGRPAYKARISVTSRTPGVPFAAEFQTDRTGYLDLPAPRDERFTIQATFSAPGVSCQSVELEVNTARDASPKDEIQLPLAGTSCHSAAPAPKPAFGG